jgi:hypothetical protein
MIPDLSRDPPRDPRIAAALREAGLVPAEGAVDWERLHAVIAARASRVLAGRRLPWWEHAARWGRAAIPLAAAATVVLALAVAQGGGATDAAAPAGSPPMLEQALAGGVSDADRGPADDEGELQLQDVVPSDGGR